MSRLLVTEAAIRGAVVAEGIKDLGYQGKVGGWNKWGAWYGPGWEYAYFCAAGWSWCWNKALGETDARSVIGRQSHGGNAPNNRGFIWTVAIIVQHRSKKVALRNLKPGDALLWKYITGDNRAGNEVNHVDLVERNFPDQGYVIVIGYNVPKPGATTGDPSRGGGVYRRRVYYNSRYLVAGLQMPAAALAERNRKAWVQVQQHLTDGGFGSFQMTGVPGPATQSAVKDYAKETGYTGNQSDPLALLPHMEKYMSNVAKSLEALTKEVRTVRDAQTRLEKKIDNQDGVLVRLLSAVSKTKIGEAVWGHPLYGFLAHWHLRRGLITDPEHRNFPADPGSPADYDLRGHAEKNDGIVSVYTPDGPKMLILDGGEFKPYKGTDPGVRQPLVEEDS